MGRSSPGLQNSSSSETKIALGPKGSFFGIAGEGPPYRYSGISSKLEKIANDRKSDIIEVALGANGHYVALRKSGGFEYRLDPKCELDQILDQAPSGSVAVSENQAWDETTKHLEYTDNAEKHVSLSPTNDNNFFISFTDGSCKFRVPENRRADIKAVAAKNSVPFTISTTPAAFMYSGYSGYSAKTNTGYRSQAVVGKDQTESVKKLGEGLSITSSILNIGFLIGSTLPPSRGSLLNALAKTTSSLGTSSAFNAALQCREDFPA
ncbi:hypothetical protein DL98DRAFT_524615 [Cadophora sp. DSE1049]|nr:hypothetical protein DL98DRAFT_524615 [Cadophora sp. DSE1049]